MENVNFADPYNMSSFGGNVSNPQYQPSIPAPSTQLARRPINSRHMIATAPRSTFDQTNDPWGPFGDDNLLDPQPTTTMEDTDNIELLEEKAVLAKRDAQAKRKQIPPFVQKLSR